MPTTPTYPGVYIEEVPSPVRTIVGVSTSVTAFVGYFPRGPLNAPVRLLSVADFEREFGGLNRDSETSYAIQQFFLNGGTEAWVVRVAHNEATADADDAPDASAAATATLALADASTTPTPVLQVEAGRRIRGSSVEDPGQWANSLRLEVDYDTAQPAQLFNLQVSEIAENGRSVVRTETFTNLSMTERAARYAVESVNERSRLVQLERNSTWSPAASPTFPGPAANGTLGGSVEEALTIPADEAELYVNAGDGDQLVAINYRGAAPTNLRGFVPYLQSAIRRAGTEAGQPLLTGAVVKLLPSGDDSNPSYRFHIAVDRHSATLQPWATLTFSNYDSDTTAGDLGLVAATVNVQQYRLGSASGLTPAYDTSAVEGEDGTLPNATVLRGSRDDKTGLYALRDVDLFNILCVPRAADLDDNSEMRAFVSEALAFCEERRAMMIVDIPQDCVTVPQMETWMAGNDTLRHNNAAVYFPRPRIADPLNGYRLKSVAACGTVAGLYARTDTARGVWKAPAGTEASLRGVQELAYKLTDAENGVLNPLGINCLRTFPVYSNVCWGARTLMGSNVQASEWKYIPVRRVVLYIEESLYRGTQWVVFEPNDEPLWSQIRLNVGAFMHRLFRQGAFQGSSPRDAYFVKCDKETTTQDDINQGIVNILVGFAPLKPAEFVIIRISQIAGQIPT